MEGACGGLMIRGCVETLSRGNAIGAGCPAHRHLASPICLAESLVGYSSWARSRSWSRAWWSGRVVFWLWLWLSLWLWLGAVDGLDSTGNDRRKAPIGGRGSIRSEPRTDLLSKVKLRISACSLLRVVVDLPSSIKLAAQALEKPPPSKTVCQQTICNLRCSIIRTGD